MPFTKVKGKKYWRNLDRKEKLQNLHFIKPTQLEDGSIRFFLNKLKLLPIKKNLTQTSKVVPANATNADVIKIEDDMVVEALGNSAKVYKRSAGGIESSESQFVDGSFLQVHGNSAITRQSDRSMNLNGRYKIEGEDDDLSVNEPEFEELLPSHVSTDATLGSTLAAQLQNTKYHQNVTECQARELNLNAAIPSDLSSFFKGNGGDGIHQLAQKLGTSTKTVYKVAKRKAEQFNPADLLIPTKRQKRSDALPDSLVAVIKAFAHADEIAQSTGNKAKVSKTGKDEESHATHYFVCRELCLVSFN